MKIAILIHAHKNPVQVKRLVDVLRHPDVDIYLNIDLKTAVEPFTDLINGITYITEREAVKWGTYSQVQQILNSYKQIIASGVPYSHTVFISGQDYPLQPIEKIVAFLNSNPDTSYLNCIPFDQSDWFRQTARRFTYWHFLPQNDIRNCKWVKKALIKAGFRRRYPLPPYYGSCWMNLQYSAIEYILQFVDNNPGFVKFNRHTACADELFFQSILANSPFRSHLSPNYYRYIDWSNDGNSPKTLTTLDLPLLEQSDAWFARKFDLDTGSELFDAIDEIRVCRAISSG